jgi:hypothetical protein
MKRLLWPLLLGCTVSCASHTEADFAVETPTSQRLLDSVASGGHSSAADRSTAAQNASDPPVPIAPEGAVVLESKVLATENLNYNCLLTILNASRRTIRGVELVDFHDNGGMHNMYNLRRSVAPLRKIKLTIAANHKATATFRVESSRVNPQIAKIFYQDGTIQHTHLDILGDQASPAEAPAANAPQRRARPAHQPKDAVEAFYEKNQETLGPEAGEPFHQIDVDPKELPQALPQ